MALEDNRQREIKVVLWIMMNLEIAWKKVFSVFKQKLAIYERTKPEGYVFTYNMFNIPFNRGLIPIPITGGYYGYRPITYHTFRSNFRTPLRLGPVPRF